MLNTKFQASKLSGSEEEDFSMYFYGSNLGPADPGISWTLGPSFEQT